METHLAVKTNGDPIGTVRKIVLIMWEQLNLEAIIFPIADAENELPRAMAIKDPGLVENLNPFKPVMVENSAKLVSDLVKKYPEKYLGILLRPCEMNTLLELSLDGGFTLNNIFTISYDCLGTLPIDDYFWKIKHKPALNTIHQKNLQFSRQGGILSYQNRPACQICSTPEAKCADLNINVFGLPVRQVILITMDGMDKNLKIDFGNLVYEKTEQIHIEQHIKTTSRIIERNSNKFLRLARDLEQILPGNLNELTAQFRDCINCLEIRVICPICNLILQKTKNSRNITQHEMIRWLVTCSGCGMCESICPEHHSMNLIFKFIRSHLEDESHPPFPYISKKEILM